MATRTLNQLLLNSRRVLLAFAAGTVLISAAALRLRSNSTAMLEQVQLPPTWAVMSDELSVVVEFAGTGEGRGYRLETQQVAPVSQLRSTTVVGDRSADVSMLATAAALLSTGALIGALVQHAVMRILDRGSPESRFP